VLVDVLLVSSDGLVAFYMRFLPLPAWHALRTGVLTLPEGFPRKPYAGFVLLYALLIVLFCQSQDLYRTLRGRSATQESWAVVRAVALATTVLAAFIFTSNVKIISRGVVGISALLNVGTLVIWRFWKRQFVTRRVAQGVGARNALIIGAGDVGMALARYLDDNKQLGYQVTGFLDANHHGDPRMLGRIEDLALVARRQFVDDIFVTIPSERDVVKSIAAEARQQRLNVKVVPELYDGLVSSASIQRLGEFPIIELHREPIPAVGLGIKRTIDVLVAALGLVAVAPLLALAAIWIRLDSAGPMIYSALRVGRKGKRFRCYKLRTMVDDADARKEKLRETNERNGPFFKMENDPRITRAGRWLRKYSIDELPQLVNVLAGNMSLVGPRPHPLDDFERYSLDNMRRLDVRPGVTGLWQVMARQDPSFETTMALDLKYIEGWSLWQDLKILLRTIPVVVRADGR